MLSIPSEITIPLKNERNSYSSSQGNSYSHGIAIPRNRSLLNKRIAIPIE
jgi:hypothetical protein